MHRRLLLAATICLLLLDAGLTAAQVPGPPGGISTGSPRDKAIEDKLRSDEIERVKRAAEKPEPRPDPEFPRIKEDFERIQIINNDVLQAQATAAAPDYARLAAAAGEIKKRAERLKLKLFPPDAEKQAKTKEPDGPQDLPSLLAALDNALAGFVANPMFQSLRVVNTQSAAQAKRALESVIKLSGKVRQAADRKRKAGG